MVYNFLSTSVDPAVQIYVGKDKFESQYIPFTLSVHRAEKQGVVPMKERKSIGSKEGMDEMNKNGERQAELRLIGIFRRRSD
jgi:hypothetical protein